MRLSKKKIFFLFSKCSAIWLWLSQICKKPDNTNRIYRGQKIPIIEFKARRDSDDIHTKNAKIPKENLGPFE